MLWLALNNFSGVLNSEQLILINIVILERIAKNRILFRTTKYPQNKPVTWRHPFQVIAQVLITARKSFTLTFFLLSTLFYLNKCVWVEIWVLKIFYSLKLIRSWVEARWHVCLLTSFWIYYPFNQVEIVIVQ